MSSSPTLRENGGRDLDPTFEATGAAARSALAAGRAGGRDFLDRLEWSILNFLDRPADGRGPAGVTSRSINHVSLRLCATICHGAMARDSSHESNQTDVDYYHICCVGLFFRQMEKGASSRFQ